MARLATRATGWRLDRRDGLRLGFTSHDRAAIIEGTLYRPQPGLRLTSLRRNGGFEPGGVDIEGAIDSDRLSAADFAAGRWRGAMVTAFTYDWRAPDGPVRRLLAARIGRIAIEDAMFRAELVETRPRADAGLVPRTSPGCRAIFCGPGCGLSAARFRHEMQVTGLDGAHATLSRAFSGAIFAGGSLRWLDGPECGMSRRIVAHDGAQVTLEEPPSAPPAPPVAVELLEGCDHDFDTCANRFGNAINFRGEPHLPGMDYLTRYPGR